MQARSVFDIFARRPKLGRRLSHRGESNALKVGAGSSTPTG